MILKRFEDFKSGDQKTYSWDEVVSYAKEPWVSFRLHPTS
jgi:hypothetical protein